MEIGKLTNDTLGEIVLSEIKPIREDILIRPGVGEDCAAIAYNDLAVVLTTDPITGSGSKLGHLAVHVCLNDIASSGAEAVGILLTLLCPVGTTKREIQEILHEANHSANAMGVEIIGGHTEITDAVNRMIISATAVGKAKVDEVVKTSGARAGDLVYLTKQAATEGTAIIAYEKSDVLDSVLTQGEIALAQSLMDEVSVVPEGSIGAKVGASAMHDATEGGVLGAIHELCEASGVGCIIEKNKIPVLQETHKICRHFGIDPLRLISSGTMVITIPEERSIALEEQLSAACITFSRVGWITEDENKYLKDERVTGEVIYHEIHAPESDELYKVV